MIPVSREALATALSAQVLGGQDGPAFTRFFTDTRAPVDGGLFFALKGERFDAHLHLESAISAGASGLVISSTEHLPDSVPAECMVAVVDDTREALGALGHHVRGRLNGPVVSITGSVGKTTVKDMCAAALSAFGEVGRSPGNWNNEIGVPLSLLSLTGQESGVVLELGMSAPGEIAHLTRIAAPSVGVVTSAVAAHLEFFDSVDGIADAKAELLEELPSSSRAVVCADDARILERGRRFRPQDLLTYGLAEDADVRVTSVRQDERGLDVTVALEGEQVQVRVPTLGRHNAVNAAGALAIVHALGHP
ncbi:MAG: UDP-N-acetylmuramoyl-tripeptide--D-alanyl-D-alanine ligase, partial [Myxococcota bacterium]|nr:UDP-N-acetylmuramoyl-tripeptide--D-alanyl-D-alanine ligase [Myxococcota bacterium]